ncbi:MAG: hypothetical protein K2K93_07695 [Muribaculaceae bacterium]|nr:hypothetical protein [Muribaculaceae bacterium]
MNNIDLHSMIDLYFAARLSAAQEEDLYRRLLACDYDDDKVSEALAVMVMARMPAAAERKASEPSRSSAKGRRLFAAAATAAVLLAAGGTLGMRYLLADRVGGVSDEMVAFVGGERVENRSVIMNIVDSQLNDIGETSDFIDLEITSDLEDIREALNNNGI